MRSLDSTGSMNQTHFRPILSGATVPLSMHINRQKASPQTPGFLKKEKNHQEPIHNYKTDFESLHVRYLSI